MFYHSNPEHSVIISECVRVTFSTSVGLMLLNVCPTLMQFTMITVTAPTRIKAMRPISSFGILESLFLLLSQARYRPMGRRIVTMSVRKPRTTLTNPNWLR